MDNSESWQHRESNHRKRTRWLYILGRFSSIARGDYFRSTKCVTGIGAKWSIYGRHFSSSHVFSERNLPLKFTHHWLRTDCVSNCAARSLLLFNQHLFFSAFFWTHKLKRCFVLPHNFAMFTPRIRATIQRLYPIRVKIQIKHLPLPKNKTLLRLWISQRISSKIVSKSYAAQAPHQRDFSCVESTVGKKDYQKTRRRSTMKPTTQLGTHFSSPFLYDLFAATPTWHYKSKRYPR